MTRTYFAAMLAAAATLAAGPAAGGIILPGIQGQVFQDGDFNGSPSAGEGIAGATLRLYRDDGDGIFEPGGGDSQVGSDYVTGADGSYAFETLDPDAGYFVQRAPLNLGGNLLPAAVSGILTPGEIGLLIDAFENNQAVKANPLIPISTSTVSDPMSMVLGDERDIFVRLLGGIGEVELRSNAFGVAVLQYDNTSGVVGQGIVTWDGIDMSANPTPSLNLGDVDLTEGGANEGLLFRLGIDASGVNESLRLRIFDESATEYSEVVVPFPMTDGTATATVYVPFTDFVGTVSASKVNAIQLILGEGARSVDAQIDLIGALGPVVQDFEVVPEPRTVVMALFGLLGCLRLTRSGRS